MKNEKMTSKAMASSGPVKDADYYLGLPYSEVVRRLAPEEGGGYMATIPELGSHTFVGDGETREEALEALDAVKRLLIPRLLQQGVRLPEPVVEDEVEQHSGKLLVRMPRELHGQLAVAARQNRCSINQLAVCLLSGNLERLIVTEELLQMVRQEVQRQYSALRKGRAPASEYVKLDR